MSISSRSADPVPDRKKQFLVLVDPVPDDVFTAGMLLQRLEYNVFTTGTAEEALQYMAIAVPAALITELLLPGMNGMELIGRVKQDPRTKDVPVIVQTSLPDPKVEELCKLAGCSAYLRKPVEHDSLYRSLQVAIEETPRHYVRLSTCLRVVVGDPGDIARGEEYVTALSENGLFVRTVNPRPVNSLLPVTIFLADRVIKAQGQVIYTFQNAAGPLKEPGMGIKFGNITLQDRDFVREFIKDELMRGLVSQAKHKWQHIE